MLSTRQPPDKLLGENFSCSWEAAYTDVIANEERNPVDGCRVEQIDEVCRLEGRWRSAKNICTT